MGWKPSRRWSWRESGHRVAVQATVIGLHLGILWLLQRPATPWSPPTDQPGDARTGLRIRFFHIPTEPLRKRAQNRPQPPAPAPEHSSSARKLAAARRPVATDASDASDVAATSTLRWSLPSVGANHDYIANRPGDGPGFSRSASRLPGSNVAIVQGIHMVDPRTQGVAGAVRAVQALFGVADHHCVDVAAWRSLSTEQLLERHISPEQVDRTAQAYHCY